MAGLHFRATALEQHQLGLVQENNRSFGWQVWMFILQGILESFITQGQHSELKMAWAHKVASQWCLQRGHTQAVMLLIARVNKEMRNRKRIERVVRMMIRGRHLSGKCEKMGMVGVAGGGGVRLGWVTGQPGGLVPSLAPARFGTCWQLPPRKCIGRMDPHAGG